MRRPEKVCKYNRYDRRWPSSQICAQICDLFALDHLHEGEYQYVRNNNTEETLLKKNKIRNILNLLCLYFFFFKGRFIPGAGPEYTWLSGTSLWAPRKMSATT